MKHDVKQIIFYDKDKPCTRIYADFTLQTITAENLTDNIIKTAFGVKLKPTWDDFLDFLEERCVPRQRDGLREYLDVLGIDEYDPFQIIQKTKGRMAEDQQWLEIMSIDGEKLKNNHLADS